MSLSKSNSGRRFRSRVLALCASPAMNTAVRTVQCFCACPRIHLLRASVPWRSAPPASDRGPLRGTCSPISRRRLLNLRCHFTEHAGCEANHRKRNPLAELQSRVGLMHGYPIRNEQDSCYRPPAGRRTIGQTKTPRRHHRVFCPISGGNATPAGSIPARPHAATCRWLRESRRSSPAPLLPRV